VIEALTLGSCAALLWGGSVICSAPASRQAGPYTALLWGNLVAVSVAALLALPTGPPSGDAADWTLVLLIGIAYAAGISLWLEAVRSADVAVLTPIVATDGGIAALLAVATGASLSTSVAVALAAMVAGVAIVAAGGTEGRSDGGKPASAAAPHRRWRSIGLAMLIACCFGFVLFASGEVDGMEPVWVVAVARAVTCVFALVVCLRKRVGRPARQDRIWIVLFGLLDVLGFVALVSGAQVLLPVAAVAASQYAAVAAIGGVIYLGERIQRLQLLGIGVLLSAAAVVAATGL
jgi:hypothetical protein